MLNAFCRKNKIPKIDNPTFERILSHLIIINNDMISLEEIHNNVNQIDKTIHYHFCINDDDSNSEELTETERLDATQQNLDESNNVIPDSTQAYKYNPNFKKGLRKKLHSESPNAFVHTTSTPLMNPITEENCLNNDLDKKSDCAIKKPSDLLNFANTNSHANLGRKNSIKSDLPPKNPNNTGSGKLDLKRRESNMNKSRSGYSLMSGSDQQPVSFTDFNNNLKNYHNYHLFWNELAKVSKGDRLLKENFKDIHDYNGFIKLLGKEKIRILRVLNSMNQI